MLLNWMISLKSAYMLLTSSVALPKALWNFGVWTCERRSLEPMPTSIRRTMRRNEVFHPRCLCLLAAGDAVFLSYTNSFFPSEIHQVNTRGSLQTPHRDDQETRVQI